MRAATPFRLLLLAAALLAGACNDADSPLEPPTALDEVPLSPEPASLAAGRWADGYLLADAPTAPSYTPSPTLSYNRSGGVINITRPAGTTGRYVATFSGLSAVLGSKNAVHVTGYGSIHAHCKPLNGSLVNDKVEVRCFKTANGAPENAGFSLVVTRKSASRAFAYAHLPTATSYTPNARGSWNPAGTTRVVRHSAGYYQVLFNSLGSRISTNGGNVQVNAVGTGSAHCKLSEEWGGSPNQSLIVACYTPTGNPVDSKFSLLFQLPAAHLAYAYGNQPETVNYSPAPYWSSNPAGGAISITRLGRGQYVVTWAGADPEIIDLGNAQVTALGVHDYAHCKFAAPAFTGLREASVVVHCFAPNGTPVDAYFTVLLGS